MRVYDISIIIYRSQCIVEEVTFKYIGLIRFDILKNIIKMRITADKFTEKELDNIFININDFVEEGFSIFCIDEKEYVIYFQIEERE